MDAFSFTVLLRALLLAFLALRLSSAHSVVNHDGTSTHHLHFKVQYTNVTRLCHTKQIVSVNGQFPGPTVYVRTGDRILAKVTNLMSEKLTIHWHGVRQMFTCWSDGPAYVTQCPLQPGASFTHDFTIVRESGTLFWHAHLSWFRATVHGAFIILPRNGSKYPFPIQPRAEFPIILGEWWKTLDVLVVERDALATGGGYNVSDAVTINGQPGLLYNCSAEDATVVSVQKGETYLLRIINAAMNFQMFFQVASHKLTVVETDCSYAKPYTTDVLLLAPGQTADVLVTADQDVDDYYIAASIYSPAPADRVPFPTTAATARFHYEGATQKRVKELKFPTFPAPNDSEYALNYMKSLRSLNSKEYPALVPQKLDRSFLFTAGYALKECPSGQICGGPQGQMISTSISNITFMAPNISILQAFYEKSRGVAVGCEEGSDQDTYEDDFPSVPVFQYNYTGVSLTDKHSEFGTKVKVLDYKSNVQLVLQNTQTLFFESHPFHLHGYNFYVVGLGEGNFNAETDPENFNLVDPPAMNTVAIPLTGWVAIRFFADNPGAWLMHCHFEMHTSWGMQMVWIVNEGKKKHEKLPPPPADYPKC